MSMYWILFIGIAVISYIVQNSLQSKFKKYSKMPLASGMTGKDVAEKMLHDNGIYDVRVTSTPGMLTDHYNPANKTVNLSEGVYGSNSVAAAAVAAHECGHALQDAEGYIPNKIRSAIAPVAGIGSKAGPYIAIAGVLLLNQMPHTASQAEECGATMMTKRGRSGNSPSTRQPPSRRIVRPKARLSALPWRGAPG